MVIIAYILLSIPISLYSQSIAFGSTLRLPRALGLELVLALAFDADATIVLNGDLLFNREAFQVGLRKEEIYPTALLPLSRHPSMEVLGSAEVAILPLTYGACNKPRNYKNLAELRRLFRPLSNLTLSA